MDSAFKCKYIIATYVVNPLNAELNPICHVLALLGAHHIFHISGLRVNRKGQRFASVNHLYVCVCVISHKL